MISGKRGRWLILERDHFRCAYCGTIAYKNRTKLHVDHIYPEMFGGKTIAGNLITCCGRCNVEKHSNIPRDYKEIQAEASKRNAEIGISDEKPIKLWTKQYVRRENEDIAVGQ